MDKPKYFWRATYTDGSQIQSVNSDGSKNKYEDIDRAKLCLFELVDKETEEVKVKLSFKDGQRLIWRRREFLQVGSDVVKRIHIVGKQETIDDINYQGIIFIDEDDGVMEVADRFNNNHPFFRAVELFDIEK